MTSRQESRLKKLGPFNIEQAKELGLSHQDLSRLVKAEKILRMSRGIYLHPKAPVNREIDFQVACKKFGSQAAVGGLSALFYYNLVEQVPNETWILVPPEKNSIEQGYRVVRTKLSLDIGIIQGNGYRIVSLERAIVEGFKLSNKIGERTVIKAAREAITQKLTTLNRIGKIAKDLGLNSYLSKYFEAIIS